MPADPHPVCDDKRITLRRVRPGDRAFLLALYGEARARELAGTFWPDAQKQAFLSSQFDARDRHYRQSYPKARFDLVLREGAPIGRLSVARSATAIRVVDMAISAAWRGQGIGTGLLRGLMDEARVKSVPVQLSVRRDNPARALYFRLGFVVTGDTPTHLAMEWCPGAGA